MNFLISSTLVFYLISFVSSVDLVGICENDQMFRFDGVQVNAVDKFSTRYQFSTLESYLSLDTFEYDDWYNAPFDVAMTKYDQELYNRHILTIYTDEFYKRPLQDFYSYQKYIRNIRKAFMNSRNMCVNNATLRQYENALTTILNKVTFGYKLINTLTTLKEGKLSENVFPETSLQRYIDSNTGSFYIFKNKILNYYYTQKLVMSNFAISKASERYRSLQSTGMINFTLFIPIYDKNFDKNAPCLNLDKLPEFYQSVDS